MGSGGIAPHILNLGDRWRWAVSFTPPPPTLYTRYPLDKRLGGPQRQTGRGGEKKKKNIHCPYRESNPDRQDSSSVTTLSYHGTHMIYGLRHIMHGNSWCLWDMYRSRWINLTHGLRWWRLVQAIRYQHVLLPHRQKWRIATAVAMTARRIRRAGM
jgi:hypothetical protein